MTELGQDPQELLEHSGNAAELMEHAYEGQQTASEMRSFSHRCAITASILAVGAAIIALLAGIASNEAIINTVEASDKWSFYQAKSTKQQIFQATKLLLIDIDQRGGAPATTAGTSKTLDKELSRYGTEKLAILKEAQSLKRSAEEELKKHESLALSTACFQIGIVLASVAILAKSRLLYWQSILAGAVGLALAAFALLSVK